MVYITENARVLKAADVIAPPEGARSSMLTTSVSNPSEKNILRPSFQKIKEIFLFGQMALYSSPQIIIGYEPKAFK